MDFGGEGVMIIRMERHRYMCSGVGSSERIRK